MKDNIKNFEDELELDTLRNEEILGDNVSDGEGLNPKRSDLDYISIFFVSSIKIEERKNRHLKFDPYEYSSLSCKTLVECVEVFSSLDRVKELSRENCKHRNIPEVLIVEVEDRLLTFCLELSKKENFDIKIGVLVSSDPSITGYSESVLIGLKVDNVVTELSNVQVVDIDKFLDWIEQRKFRDRTEQSKTSKKQDLDRRIKDFDQLVLSQPSNVNEKGESEFHEKPSDTKVTNHKSINLETKNQTGLTKNDLEEFYL